MDFSMNDHDNAITLYKPNLVEFTFIMQLNYVDLHIYKFNIGFKLHTKFCMELPVYLNFLKFTHLFKSTTKIKGQKERN